MSPPRFGREGVVIGRTVTGVVPFWAVGVVVLVGRACRCASETLSEAMCRGGLDVPRSWASLMRREETWERRARPTRRIVIFMSIISKQFLNDLTQENR